MGLFGLFGDNDNSAEIARNTASENKLLYNLIGLPEYTQENPELYNFKSADYQTIADNPLLKSARMAALAKLSGLADTGMSDIDNQGFENARSEANQIARSGTEAALQSAQNRGVGGGGLEFAMREIANQGAAERARKLNTDQAATSARQRALYQMAYGDALNRESQNDYQRQSANTGIINQFNQMNTQGINKTNNANTDAINEAFKYNEALKDKNYQNRVGRADRQSGFNNQFAQIGYNENAAANARRQREAGAAGAAIGSFWGPAGSSVGYSVGSSLT